MLLASTTSAGAANEPLFPSYGDKPCWDPSSAGMSPFLEDYPTDKMPGYSPGERTAHYWRIRPGKERKVPLLRVLRVACRLLPSEA